jgi:hypothetical protein
MQHQFVAALRCAAALAGMAALAAACSSGAPPASSGASTSTDLSVAVGTFVHCMHAHGDPGVYLSRSPSTPDPGTTVRVFHGFAIRDAGLGSARFLTAMKGCQHLLPHGTPPSAAGLHQAFIQGVKAAQCMRAHGYPAWPDPARQYNTQPVPPAGIDTQSPQFQAAARTCGMSPPPGGGP